METGQRGARINEKARGNCQSSLARREISLMNRQPSAAELFSKQVESRKKVSSLS